MRKIWKVVLTLALTVSAGGAIAQTPHSLDSAKGITDALKEFVRTHTTKGITDWFKAALTCDKPGGMLFLLRPDLDDAYGTRCHEDGRVHVMSGGINYGLIEKFRTAGVPVDWLRKQLATPATLKSVYELVGPDVIHEIVKISMSGNTYAEIFVYGRSDTHMIDRTKLGDHAAEYIDGFVLRRLSEAKPADRKALAETWKMIIDEQVTYLLLDPALVKQYAPRR
jgi:hypothetical protein